MLLYGHLSKTLLSCRFSHLFSFFFYFKASLKVRIAPLLCLFSLFSITSQNYSFDEKPKMESTIMKTPNSRWHTARMYSVPVFVKVCAYLPAAAAIEGTVLLSAYSLVYWHHVLQYVYHNSTMLLLSQFASASGGLFSVWDCMVHPTHPEGI